PGGTSARLARLDPVAHAPVAARGPVRDRRVLAAGGWIARVGRARVRVVAVERRPRGAAPRLTGLGAVAGVPVAASGIVRQRLMLAAGHGVADVAGTGIAVVAVERRARRARARLTGLGAVAHVAVTARGAVRQRGVRADARVADVRRTRVVVDAVRVRGAGKAARDGSVDAGAHRVARIGGARVSVVAVEGWPHGADPRQARLGTVAHVAVAARGAVEDRRVLAARHRVADVGRARVPVVAVEGRPRGAGPRQARLGAVAHVAVAARGAVRQRRAPTSGQRVAGVGRTRIVVVAVERCPRDAAAGQAGL